MTRSLLILGILLYAWSAAAAQTAATPTRPTDGPVAAGGQQGDPALEELVRQALDRLNEARADAGLRLLVFDNGLANLARRHSEEQAARGRVSHHSYEFGLSTERRVRLAYPDVPRLGENVARNRDVARLHQALMDSPGHRRNRMDSEFTHVGIGLARANAYVLYLTEVFVTTKPSAPLGEPLLFYFDAAPDTYERRENPSVELGEERITVGPPGTDDPEHWTDRGIQAFARGDLEGAEEDFRTALEIDPDYHYAAFDLARVLLLRGSYPEAAEILDGLLLSRPADVDALAARGRAALLMQEYVGAERRFRSVLEARPRDAGTWYNLGLSLEYRELFEEAEAAYIKALDLDPRLTEAQVALGRIRRR